MNPIDTYLKQKRELEYFREWRSLIGKEYFGGTRGKGGEYGSVVSAQGSLTIYHQASDGATNYHDLDKALVADFGEVMKEMSTALLDRLEARLVANLEPLRKAAEALSMELNATP